MQIQYGYQLKSAKYDGKHYARDIQKKKTKKKLVIKRDGTCHANWNFLTITFVINRKLVFKYLENTQEKKMHPEII